MIMKIISACKTNFLCVIIFESIVLTMNLKNCLLIEISYFKNKTVSSLYKFKKISNIMTRKNILSTKKDKKLGLFLYEPTVHCIS